MNDGVNARLEKHAMMNRQSPDSRNLYLDPTGSGVTVSWLATVFDMDEKTVRARLKHCPPKLRRARGEKMQTVLYDVKEAARYLVTPAFGTVDYLRAVKRGQLPPALQQTIWDALLKRQKWEENAGDLWRTAKVREVMRSVFQNMKFTVQLWADTVERQTELSASQRELIVRMADALQAELYASLVEKLASQSTGSQLEEMAELVGEDLDVKTLVTQVESDDEIEALI